MAIDRTQYNLLVDDSGAGTDGTVWDKNKVKVVILDPIDQNGVRHDATYNDGSAHVLGTFIHDISGRIHIIANVNVITVVPFYPNGGSGVAYRWTYLDPDTGWNINTSGSFSFTDGSSVNTYTVTFSGAAATVSIQRTGGTTAYRVLLIADPTPA